MSQDGDALHIIIVALGTSLRLRQRCERVFQQLASRSASTFDRHVIVDNASAASFWGARDIHVHPMPEELPAHPSVDLRQLYRKIAVFAATRAVHAGTSQINAANR